MKCYHIYRTPEGVKADVIQEIKNGPQVSDVAFLNTRPLRHIVKHSPTGFEFGYTGNGPSDLARCILIDAGYDVLEIDQCYHDFKLFFIAKIDHDTREFYIYEDAVNVWWSQRHGGTNV